MSNDTSGDGSPSCLSRANSYALIIPIYYTIIFLSIIFICSILYFIPLRYKKIIYVKEGSVISYVKEYVKILWKFRSMYGSILTQLFDQVSDISVINQLYYLSKDERNGIVTCDEINTTYLFGASLVIFFFYRILSSILIYRFSRGDFKLLVLQFFELSFIETLKINYQFQNTFPCSPQRYLMNLEAM